MRIQVQKVAEVLKYHKPTGIGLVQLASGEYGVVTKPGVRAGDLVEPRMRVKLYTTACTLYRSETDWRIHFGPPTQG